MVVSRGSIVGDEFGCFGYASDDRLCLWTFEVGELIIMITQQFKFESQHFVLAFTFKEL